MINILLDQGLPRSAATILRDEGWNVLHTGEIGLSRYTDKQILEYAQSEQRIIITSDSDFHAILALTNAPAPSVIRIRLEGLRGPELALLIKRIWPKIEPQIKKGAMVTVTKSGIRIRSIPLLSARTIARIFLQANYTFFSLSLFLFLFSVTSQKVKVSLLCVQIT